MRILHVCICLDTRFGGPSRGLATLATAQAQRGDQVAVIPSVRTDGQQTLISSDRINVITPPIDGTVFGGVAFFNRTLRKVIHQAALQTDIIHIHSTWRYHLVAAAMIARKLSIPYIVRPAGNLGRATRNSKRWLKRPYFELVERRIHNRAAGIHCTSNKEKDEIQELELTSPTFVVTQPVDAASLDTKNPECPGDRCSWLKRPGRNVTFLGRISSIKNLEVLLIAFSKVLNSVRDLNLILAGPHEDQNLVSKLRQIASDAQIESQLCLPGMLEGEEKHCLLNNTDIFVMPSIHENFGVAVVEAMHFGVVPIVSTGVGIADLLLKREAGIVCAPTVEGIAEAMLKALNAEESVSADMARSAVAATREFEPSNVANRLNDEYVRAIRNHS